jgi:hypothetical protein
LKATQACRGAPWVIRSEDLDAFATQSSLRDGPQSSDPDQLSMEFQ